MYRVLLSLKGRRERTEMLRVAICDDSRRDVERLESALERLEHYHIQCDVI